MISLTEEGNYKDPDAVEREFRSLVSKLRGLLSQSFDVNGELIVADPNLAIFSVGDYKFSSRIADHDGWLISDGRAVSRTTYKSYFDEVGTTYGVGDGATTFNLPDMRGRFPLGKAASGTGSTVGSTGGALDHTHSGGSHTHSITSGGGHSHTVDSHTHTGPSHTHTFTDDGAPDNGAGPNLEQVDDNADGIQSGVMHGNWTTHSHSGTTDAGGTGTTSGPSAQGTDTQGAHDHGGATGGGSGATGTGNPAYLVGVYFVYMGI